MYEEVRSSKTKVEDSFQDQERIYLVTASTSLWRDLGLRKSWVAMSGVVNKLNPCNNLMSELQEPLMSKETGSGSPEDPAPVQAAVTIDHQLSTEDRFLKVLQELESLPVPTVKDLKSSVLCSCSCRLGVIVGLRYGPVALVGLDAEITMLGKHEEQVNCISMTSDGKYIVSGSNDKSVRIWDIEERKQVAVLKGHSKGVNCISMASNGKYIVSGSNDKTVRIWDFEERKQVAVLEGHTNYLSCISMTSDGKYIASGSHDKTIKIWDIEERKQVAVLTGHSREVNCISMTSDGKYIVSGSNDNTVRIWDIEERKQVAVLEGHTNRVSCISVTYDGKYIVSGSDDKTIRIWDIEERKQVAVLEEHTDYVNCISMTSDGKYIVSGSRDKTVRIWDIEERKQIAVLQGHTDWIRCISMTSDGKYLVSGSDDKTARIWDIEERKQVPVLEGHTESVRCISMTSDGKYLVSGSDDKTVRIWDIEEIKQVAVLEGHTSSINCISTTYDGKYIVSGSTDNTVRIWDIEERKQVVVLEGHTSSVYCISMAYDGKYIVSGSQDNTVRIWDLEERKQVAVLEGHTSSVYCISMTYDGKYIVSGSNDKTVRIWDIEERNQVAVLQGHSLGVSCISMTSDGKYIVSGSGDNTVRIWDIEERKQVTVLEGHTDYVNCISMTSDGKYIVSGSGDKTVRIWDIEERKQVAVLEGHTSSVYCISMTSDGKYIVSGSFDHTVRIWDIEERKQFAVLEGHSREVNCISITPDGRQLVSGSVDKTIRIVDWTMTIPTLRSDFLRFSFDHKELSPVKTYYFCGQYQEFLKQGKSICRSLASSPILPHYFNSLHICAYYNQFTALKAYLEQGVPIIRGVFGSPLTVALMKNSTKCINVILQYFINQVDTESGSFGLQEIVEDFPNLLLCNASAMIPFFLAMLNKSTQTLPEFIVPSVQLPCTILQTSKWVNLHNFAEFDGNELVKQNGEIVEFLISRFHWNFALGSVQSLQFLRALEDCQDRHILTTPLVTSLVQSKWEKLLLITRTHTFLYICSLLCLVGLTFNYLRPDVLSLVFLSFNSLFLLYEVVQSLANGADYWKDPWNYLDLTRGLTSVIWGYLVFSEVSGLHYLHFAVVSLCFLRGFTFFRTFKMTRVFVRMVIEVVKEMYAFLVILAYSTCSFGMMYAVLMPDVITSASGAWTSAYELLMGTHDETDFDVLKWLCFTAASLMNVIIMLNLLISILGDAYEKAQMSASENDNLEMLKLVIEYESMFFWRRNAKKSSVLVVCKSVGEDDAEDEWAGRVNNIKRAMEKNLKDTQILLEKKLDVIEKSRKDDESASGQNLEEKLKENRTAMEEKLEMKLQENRTVMEESLRTAMEENRRVMESKFDQVLAALQALH